MTGWSAADLGRLDATEELEIAAIRTDGSRRAARPIWVVRCGGEVYVRAASVSGSAWHRVARASGRARISIATEGFATEVEVQPADPVVFDAVDAAYREKYGRRYASIVAGLVDAEHRATTLRLVPGTSI